MVGIKVERVLPPELTVDSIDDILYSIGLSHESVRDRPKRSTIHNPILIFVVVFTQLITKIMTYFNDDEWTLLLLADFGHYLGIKYTISNDLIIVSSITIFMQSVYFYNYKRKIKPTFVRVFQVMSGSVTPCSVGLTRERQVMALLRIAKWLTVLKCNI